MIQFITKKSIAVVKIIRLTANLMNNCKETVSLQVLGKNGSNCWRLSILNEIYH